MSNYLTTDGLKKILYFRRPPFGQRPVAFATSATWLIRHCSRQWPSRTFGRSGWWSNLPPFRLRFWKLESLFKV